jgi:formylglycine-generating enzyme required for sulfatase activity
MQFQAFVEAPNGYQNSNWWEGLPVSSPHVRRQEFKYDNHPRDNVSWYNAIAFCRWLSAKLGQVITLPTEQQWEKAARGTDGRAWPWGNQYRVGYANVDERDDHNPVGPTYFRSTTAVGLYPRGKSPYGVMDMCGNVWEWCLNDASDMDGTAMGDPAAPKQLRGGSWNNNIDVAPTYHRYTDWVSRPILPTYRNWRVGFRVVALD